MTVKLAIFSIGLILSFKYEIFHNNVHAHYSEKEKAPQPEKQVGIGDKIIIPREGKIEYNHLKIVLESQATEVNDSGEEKVDRREIYDKQV